MREQDFANIISINKTIRDSGFKDFAADCATRVSQVIDYHLAANPGVGVMEMNEQQLKNLISDVMLVTNQLRKYGEKMPDAE